MFQKQLIQVGTIQTAIIHHSKHVYKQSNPCGSPPMTFEHDLSKRHFGHISCICLPNPINSIEMCSKWPKAMIDCDQGQIGVIWDTFALNQSGRGPLQRKSRIWASTTRIKSAVAASAVLSHLKCLNTPFLWSRTRALVLRFPKLVLKSKIRPPGQKLRRDKNCKISKEKLVHGAIQRSSGLLKHERESSGTHFHSAKSNGEPSRPLWQNFISTRFRRFRVRKWIFQKKIVLEKFYKSKKANRL